MRAGEMIPHALAVVQSNRSISAICSGVMSSGRIGSRSMDSAMDSALMAFGGLPLRFCSFMVLLVKKECR